MALLERLRPLHVEVAVVVALAVAVATASQAFGAPPASTAGDGAGVLVYPPIANVPMVRARKALDRAVDAADDGRPKQAVAALTVVRLQMAKAWTGARYVIEHAPPPPAGDDIIGAVAGDGPVAPSYAGPEDTAFAVLTLQHDVATTAIGELDTARRPVLGALAATANAAVRSRDAAISYIHQRPAPPATDDVAAARPAGDTVVPTWATVMPQVVPQLDTELQQIDATRPARSLAPAGRRFLRAAQLQVAKTRQAVATWWPPLPAGD
jgi:hypothetical protein